MAETIVPRVSTLLTGGVPLIPVLHVENLEHAEPLARALAEAGIGMIEVTLRSAVALQVIERMIKAAPSAVVGAGTITRPEQFAQVKEAGARFAVSPGLTPRLAEAGIASGMPYIPGAVTPSEILAAREFGFREMKFFPADLNGATAGLKHVQPLYPDVRFCPTGGIGDANMRSYLDLPNCFAVGGAWLAPKEMVEAANWAAIRDLAATSVKLAKSFLG